MSEVAEHGGDGGADIRFIRHITAVGADGAARLGGQLGGALLRGRSADIEDGHAAALVCQRGAVLHADAGSAAGNNGNFASQIKGKHKKTSINHVIQC